MHLHLMEFVQMLFEGLSLVDIGLGCLFLSQIFVTILTICQMRVFSQSNVNVVGLFEMLGNGAVRPAQMAMAIVAKRHGAWMAGLSSLWSLFQNWLFVVVEFVVVRR